MVKYIIMNFLTKVFSSTRAAWIFAACASLLLTFAAVWFGSLNQDEGWYLYAAQMVGEGKSPYRDFFFTQGPIMPIVYSVFAPLWQSLSSPLHGLLGGRIITAIFGLAMVFSAVILVRKLVYKEHRAIASISVFSIFACNLYHLYFTSIPKTYALGSFFLVSAFLLLYSALQKENYMRGVFLFVSGLAFAFSSGTRISLILVPLVVGISLICAYKRYGFSFLPFGIGTLLGLFVTYGVFALNDMAREGLFAAQWYHASRGGFDLFFALGSVLRLLRGYAALAIVALCVLVARFTKSLIADLNEDFLPKFVVRVMLVSFACVFFLQLSAPFPYDDYQVPIMALVAIPIVVAFSRYFPEKQYAWFVVAVSLFMSGTSSMLQDWTTYTPDRFWSSKMECSELAKLRKTAREINNLDPDGKTILTQDIYLAVETSRKVPEGFEMGPFSLFPSISIDRAVKIHVHNLQTAKAVIEKAPCSVAAMSGYGFAISAPKCDKVSEKDRSLLFSELEKKYDIALKVEHFGQNDTMLNVYKRRESSK